MVYHPSIPVVIRWVVMFLHDDQLVPRVSKEKSPTPLHKQQRPELLIPGKMVPSFNGVYTKYSPYLNILAEIDAH